MTYGLFIHYIAGYLDYTWCNDCGEYFCDCGPFQRDFHACITAMEMGYY